MAGPGSSNGLGRSGPAAEDWMTGVVTKLPYWSWAPGELDRASRSLLPIGMEWDFGWVVGTGRASASASASSGARPLWVLRGVVVLVKVEMRSPRLAMLGVALARLMDLERALTYFLPAL